MSNDRIRESREQKLEASRPQRVPLREQQRNKLTVRNQDPNFMYYIVNDTGDKVARMKLAGWEIAPETIGFGDTGSNQSLGTGSRIDVGGGTTGVLMRIRREYYEEDRAAEEAERKAQERIMLRSKHRDDGLEGDIQHEVRTGRKIKSDT